MTRAPEPIAQVECRVVLQVRCRREWALALALVASAGLAACSSSSSQGGDQGNPDNGGASAEPTQAPEFAPGQGQAAGGRLHPYPAGPYGVGQGSVIPNFKFYGYPDASKSRTAQVMELSDFYNPTGDAKFADGSGYAAGEAKPRMLAIAIGAVWCPPCNDEAKNELPAAHAQLAPLGGELLYVLAEGPTPGTPATQTHLNNWDTKYKVDYPSVLDPSGSVQAVFPASAFPTNLVVDTRTMTIVTKLSGEPTQAYWDAIAKKLQPSP